MMIHLFKHEKHMKKFKEYFNNNIKKLNLYFIDCNSTIFGHFSVVYTFFFKFTNFYLADF